MRDRKKIVKLIGLALLLLVVVFVYMYIKADSSRQGIDNVILGQNQGNKYFAMDNDVPIETTFRSESEVIKSIKLYFTYGVQNLSGSVDVAVIDVSTGQVVRTATVGCPSMSWVYHTEFYFPEPIKGALDREYKLQVVCHNVPANHLSILGRADDQGERLCLVTTMPGSGAYTKVLTIVFILLIITITAIYLYSMFAKNFKVHVAYLILASGIGIIMNLCIPFRVAPDERTHSYKAYEISNSLMGIELSESGFLMMRAEDRALFNNPSDFDYSFFDTHYDHFLDKAYHTELVETDVKPVHTQRYLFVFSGIGVTIGRLLGLGAIMTFMLGRWMNLIAFILITSYAIRKIPFGKSVVLVWSLLPIMMQQAGSFSYDSTINALSVLIISLTLSFMYGEKTDNRKKSMVQAIILVLAAILVAPCKSFALVPLGLFPIAIVVKYLIDNRNKIKEKFEANKKLKIICLTTVILVVVIGLAVGGLLVNKVLGGATGDGHYLAWINENAYSIGYYLKNPIEFIGRYINTLWTGGTGYFLQMLGGYLGWLDIEVPAIFVLPFFLLLIYAGMRRQDEELIVSVPSKVWMWTVFVGVVFLASLGMLLFWTPKSGGYINGIQGRYFLPALILPMLAVRTKKSCVGPNADRVIACAVPVIYIFIITTLLKFALW